MKTCTLLLTALCLSATLSAQQTLIGTLTHGGLTRNYRLYVPALYNANTPVPLVFNLHGYGSNGWEQELYGNFTLIADTANFLVVHPEGTPDVTNELFWNAGFGAQVDDIGFLSALLDTLSSQYAIDANRVYSTGMSNGGFMSYTLACALSNRITAVASVTGSMTPFQFNACAPGRAVPAMQIHGTADPTVPYLGNVTMTPIEDVVNYWADQNNCPTPPIMTPVPNLAINDGCTAEHYVWGAGDNGATVEFFKVLGGGHTWPGAPVNIGVTCHDFSASREIWRFFRQFSLSQFTDVRNPENAPALQVAPNPFSEELVVSLPQGQTDGLLTLTDLNGRVWQQQATQGQSQVLLHTADMPAGLYVLTLRRTTDGSLLAIQKLLKS